MLRFNATPTPDEPQDNAIFQVNSDNQIPSTPLTAMLPPGVPIGQVIIPDPLPDIALNNAGKESLGAPEGGLGDSVGVVATPELARPPPYNGRAQF